MECEKVQAVFLLDTCPIWAGKCQQYFRSLCLVCARILLFLSRFPNKEHLGQLKWNFKIFNSQQPERSMRARSAQFNECRSELLQKFFQELQESLEAAQESEQVVPSTNTSSKPVKLVYSALASTVQDFVWDAPEIVSPARPIPKSNKRKGGGHRGQRQSSNENRSTRNIIFVCSPCPKSEQEVTGFCLGPSLGQPIGDHISREMLQNELLPPALLSQLGSKAISVHWLDTKGYDSLPKETETTGPALMSKVLRCVHGTVIPITSLVRPVSNQLIQKFLPIDKGRGVPDQVLAADKLETTTCNKCTEGNTTCEQSEALQHGDTEAKDVGDLLLEEGSRMGGIVCPDQSNSHSPFQVKVEIPGLSHMSVSCATTASIHTKQKANKQKSSSFPSQEFLSSLVFPSSTFLSEYLHSRSSSTLQNFPNQTTPSLDDSDLFWFCTTGGRTLSILETHPIHHFVGSDLSTSRHKKRRGPTNNTSEPESLQEQQLKRKSRDRGPRSYNMTSTHAGVTGARVRSEKRKIRKKLSFSKAAKGNDGLNVGKEGERTGHHQSECSSSELSNTSANPDNSFHLEEEMSQNCMVPHVVALGVVKQSDIHLSWLSATDVYSCAGLYIPREVRRIPIDIGGPGHVYTTESNNATKGAVDEPTGSLCSQVSGTGTFKSPSRPAPLVDSSTTSPPSGISLLPSNLPSQSSSQLGRQISPLRPQSSCTDPNAVPPIRPKTPKNPTIRSPNSSPYEHGLLSSPQIHLFRHPITPPSGCNSRSSICQTKTSPVSTTGLNRRSPRLNPRMFTHGTEPERRMTSEDQHINPDMCLRTTTPACTTPSRQTARKLLHSAPTTPPQRGPDLSIQVYPITPKSHYSPRFNNTQTPPNPSLSPGRRTSPRLAAMNSQCKQNIIDERTTCGMHTLNRGTGSPMNAQHKCSPSISPKCPVIYLRDIMASKSKEGSEPETSLVISIPLQKLPLQDRRHGQTSEHLSKNESIPPTKEHGITTRPLCRDQSSPMVSEFQKMQPAESLALSDRCFSRQYQSLCHWLAKNGLLMLVDISPSAGQRRLGVLQPITSLVATLSLVKPQYYARLLGEISTTVPPQLKPASNCDSGIPNPVAMETRATSESKRDNATQHKQLPQVATNQSSLSERIPQGCNASDMLKECAQAKSSAEESVMTCNASDPELYVSLQLLFCSRALKHDSDADSLHCTVLESLLETAPFTTLSLLPWYPYLQDCGVSQLTVEKLQDLQLDTKDKDNGVSQKKASLLSTLKDFYGSGMMHPTTGQVSSGDTETEGNEAIETEKPLGNSQVEQMCPENTSAEDPLVVSDAPPRPSTTDELLWRFKSDYEEQIKTITDGDSMQRWVAKAMSSLRDDFLILVSKEEGYRVESGEEKGGGRKEGGGLKLLWEWLKNHVLLSSVKLKEKYEGLPEEDVDTQTRKLTEYQLQVLFYCEAMRVCYDVGYNTTVVADELVLLLRRISLLANPGLLGYCLRELILPNYADSCRAVLTEVYEGLMLPLPSHLTSSPDVHSGTASPAAASNDDEEEEEASLLSIQETLAPPQLAHVASKGLTRRSSFQDVKAQRQITVPSRRNKKSKASKDTRMLSDDLSQKGKSVCRSLFSRSLSDVGGKRKREPNEINTKGSKKPRILKHHHTLSEILVKETPLKKQQVKDYRRFKLQRLRSKTQLECSPGVMVIEESPRKSFYSAPKLAHPKPIFKSPPAALEHKHLSPKLLLKKEPSPAALHSLLHGPIISPAGDRSILATPVVPTTVEESPDLFEDPKEPLPPQRSTASSSKAARMLTYDTEDPLKFSKSARIIPAREDCSTFTEGCSKPSISSEKTSVCFLTDLDPSIENETASMVAFALSTPTKDDPRDFHQAFQNI